MCIFYHRRPSFKVTIFGLKKVFFFANWGMTFNNLSIKQIARLRPCLNSAIIQVSDRYKVFTHGLMEYMLISFLAKRFLKELLSRIFLRIVFVVLKHENLLPIRINHSLVQCPCHGPNKVNLSKTMSFIGALNKEIILISYSAVWGLNWGHKYI